MTEDNYMTAAGDGYEDTASLIKGVVYEGMLYEPNNAASTACMSLRPRFTLLYCAHDSCYQGEPLSERRKPLGPTAVIM